MLASPVIGIFKRPFTHNFRHCTDAGLWLESGYETTTFTRLIGYARVSTDEQLNDVQLIELKAAGCHTVFEEQGSGASRARPVLAKLLREINAGEVLVVVRLDRLARSVSHLLHVIEQLEEKGAHFRSLHDPIDTSTGHVLPAGSGCCRPVGTSADFRTH
jgi:hypothetical protein